jgi:hypothetical protein
MNAAAIRRAGAVIVALTVTCAAAPSRAADDGQASLLSGIATTFGLTQQDDPQIDYRERSKLVLPPKKTLPPPAAANRDDGAWPMNVEAAREKKRKALDDGEPSARDVSSRAYTLVKPGDDVKVTTSGLDKTGPSCRIPDPKTGECPDPPHASINWNPLTWVGLQKKPQTVLGPEPERENLVDPPKGYREPAEGVGAKIDN